MAPGATMRSSVAVGVAALQWLLAASLMGSHPIPSPPSTSLKNQEIPPEVADLVCFLAKEFLIFLDILSNDWLQWPGPWMCVLRESKGIQGCAKAILAHVGKLCLIFWMPRRGIKRVNLNPRFLHVTKLSTQLVNCQRSWKIQSTPQDVCRTCMVWNA